MLLLFVVDVDDEIIAVVASDDGIAVAASAKRAFSATEEDDDRGEGTIVRWKVVGAVILLPLKRLLRDAMDDTAVHASSVPPPPW